ncbi:hypothetical protein CK820_G0038434 [Pan troglodytes]|uniref:Uncharacterized protein n=1 Tax=Pan troglodytes TaxID=9598 RepID=A0A2J8KJ60_PANTR|nr:hypothetical protein CK820_G0038434 [Pan troglodytes]
MTSGPQTNQPKKHLTNFKSVTKETRFIRGLKTLAPVTDWEGSLPLVFNHCRDASLDYTPTFQGCQTTQGCLPWSFTTSGKSRFSGEGASTPIPSLLVSTPSLLFQGQGKYPNSFSPCLYPFSAFPGTGRVPQPLLSLSLPLLCFSRDRASTPTPSLLVSTPSLLFWERGKYP